MVNVLESHLALLEREAEARPGVTTAERAGVVGELIALHAAVFGVMERHVGVNGLAEAHRPLVPLFRRWLETARRIVAAARDLRAAGHPVGDLDDLLRAMNRAKPVAEDFDHVVRLNARLARGEAGTYRPLGEVMDGLRSPRQPPG
jgi:hypothetical protein